MSIGDEQAFPRAACEVPNGWDYGWPGLTKREFFAAEALKGFISSQFDRCSLMAETYNKSKRALDPAMTGSEICAQAAVELADMLCNALASQAATEVLEISDEAARHERWMNEFFLALGAMGAAVNKLGKLPQMYFEFGWPPVEAAENETRDETLRRLITDGPEPQAGEAAA